jgi:NTP pyrophosphatase (non-canonical NTP hydrolase)
MQEPVVKTLEDVWPLQAELNARVGIDTLAIGRRLAEQEAAGTLAPEGGPRLEAGKALKNYLDALASECHELLECLSWKHWYQEARQGRQYELRDVQNARVEAADMLFFWVSICQCLGLAPQDVCRLYEKKLAINHRRRDEDRSQSQHARHEGENRQVV